MPDPSRWPLISTSFSGIPDAVLDAMKERAADQGMTYRAAVEEACTALLADLAAGEEVDWPATVAGSRIRGIRLDHTMVDALNREASARNYKINTLFAAAMVRWLAGHGVIVKI